MKNKFIAALIFTLVFFKVQGQNSIAQQVANRIAQKMKDTLSLSNAEKDSIYAINMQINDWKMAVRQQYEGHDSLRYYLQSMENRRDSLYRNVLDENKYQLYRQKKRNIVSLN